MHGEHGAQAVGISGEGERMREQMMFRAAALYTMRLDRGPLPVYVLYTARSAERILHRTNHVNCKTSES